MPGRGRRRADAIHGAALRLGASFHDRDESVRRLAFFDFPLFQGWSLGVDNVVRGLFSREAREFFQQEKHWIVEGGGEWLVAHSGKLVKPSELTAFLERAGHIAKLLVP